MIDNCFHEQLVETFFFFIKLWLFAFFVRASDREPAAPRRWTLCLRSGGLAGRASAYSSGVYPRASRAPRSAESARQYLNGEALPDDPRAREVLKGGTRSG